MTATATALPLRAAAARMGMTTDTLRKRLQRGLTPGRKVDGQWFVVPGPVPDSYPESVPDEGVDVSGLVLDESRPGPDQSGHVQDHRDAPGAPQEPPGGTLLSDRAAEMARYSRELLAPVLVRLEAQATEIGVLTERTTHLQTELERATARIAELEAPPVAEVSVQQNAAAPHAAERRSWWRRLFSWDAAAGGA
jgi:hypothetical protein